MNENHPNPGPATGGSAVEYVEFTGQAITNPEELKKMDERIQRYDPISLRRIDHVRFFVGNARQSAYFYRNAFGFDVIAYAGLETKLRHEAGYVLRQGDITFVLTSPLGPEHHEAHRLMTHGDGVMDVAIEVDDVKHTYRAAVERGAVGVVGPRTLEDE